MTSQGGQCQEPKTAFTVGSIAPVPYLLMALATSPKRAIAQAVKKAMRPTSQYAPGR